MKFIQRPQPFDAVLVVDLRTALDFLQTGEFTMIEQDKITVLTASGQAIVRFGEHYLMRDAFGIGVLPRDAFERTYMSADFESPTFSACRDDEDDHYLITCSACGPLGVTDDVTDAEVLVQMAIEHSQEAHQGE